MTDCATLTREQKRAIASALINAAGNLIEVWDERIEKFDETELRGIPAEAAATQISKWLRHLPGDAWDVRLPDPNDV